MFLDVETTGLSWFYDQLTIVGWASQGRYDVHVAGDNPDRLLDALGRAQALVTFNGTLFDLRFLKKQFGEIELPPVHIDLRYLSKRADLVGGQKNIEKAIGLPNRVGFEDMDGAEAVLLWHRFVRGDHTALKRLIEYNRYDVLGMCGILDEVLDRLDVHPDLLFTRPRFSDYYNSIQTRDLPKAPGRKARTEQTSSHTFKELFSATPAEKAVIIGIDLTGSEKRPSGRCTLRGSAAETNMVATDDEMIFRALAERPALVSDPFSSLIPFGRVRVEDDDPGRNEFGFMRRCERELKRRGVNVYPCLLPSMQGLTRRGMRLAERLRSMGIPVIESYPGAAQDILGIPRKGAGNNS